MFVYSPPFTRIHLLNLSVQLSFDYILFRIAGGIMPIVYLLLSSFLAGSLHPCAGHFIAEHYFFEAVQRFSSGFSNLKKNEGDGEEKTEEMGKHEGLQPPETYSYYGPLNALTYNVGLHNEHHDFPAIPWTKLPVLHDIAREFYDPLPCHRSWTWVIWTFILDSNVGMWCRVKRAQGGRVVGGGKGRGGEGISAASAGPEEGDGWKESEIQN